MTAPLTLLIVGGYGTFGGRIVELLEHEPRLRLIVAGRSLAKATEYCRHRSPDGAQLIPAAFDREGDITGQLRELRPEIVIDASGPFQGYGEDRYRLVAACLSASIDYLDIADGAEFVSGIDTWDHAARAGGRFVLSGVSSFPVLTAAVVRHVSSDLARVDGIRGGIAPSPFAGVGRNVIRAIAGYAGQPVSVRREGKTEMAYPFTEQMHFTVAPPGQVPLGRTLFSLVDVPDLRALQQLWPDATDIWMGAGPVPELLHRALIMLAWLVRLGLVRNLTPFAPLMFFASNHLRWGEHRGGMFLEVTGIDTSGNRTIRTWHLLAEADDGPLIPSMAVAAIVGKILNGDRPSPGARAAVRDLELGDYGTLFKGRRIHTGWRDDQSVESAPLYQRILGNAWTELPPGIRRMHEVSITASAEGEATVERGKGLLSRLVAKLVGFPATADETPVIVHFDAADGMESWMRHFGNTSFRSHQFAGRNRSTGLLCERFGPLTFAMALIPEADRLRLVLRRWSLVGLPLPMWLAPRSDSYEAMKDGKFRFSVTISHPLTGLIVAYRGWLERLENA